MSTDWALSSTGAQGNLQSLHIKPMSFDPNRKYLVISFKFVYNSALTMIYEIVSVLDNINRVYVI